MVLEMIMDYLENMFVFRITVDPVGGDIDGFEDKYYYGRRTAECMMANFRNLHKQDTDFVGGYMAFMGAWRDRGAGDQSAGTNRCRV